MDYWKSIEHLQPPPLYRGRAKQNWKDTSTNVRKTKKKKKRKGEVPAPLILFKQGNNIITKAFWDMKMLLQILHVGYFYFGQGNNNYM